MSSSEKCKTDIKSDGQNRKEDSRLWREEKEQPRMVLIYMCGIKSYTCLSVILHGIKMSAKIYNSHLKQQMVEGRT